MEAGRPVEPIQTMTAPKTPTTDDGERNLDRPGHREARAHAAEQPFEYPRGREFVEPDWRRLPGYRDVTVEQWESAQWQRAHTVKNVVELKVALGAHLTDALAADLERDMRERATMSMLIP